MPFDSNITANTTFTAAYLRKFNITKGQDQTFYLESDNDITIVSDGPFDEFDSFILYYGENANKKILMDDLTEGTDYVVEEGSTKLTLKNSFLKTLGADKYYVGLIYYNPNSYGDGYAATTLTIKAGSEPLTPTETNNATETINTTDTTNNPQTGDNIMLYISMLGLSIIGLAGAVIYIKKKRFN